MPQQDRVRIGIRLAPPTDVSAWLIEAASLDAAGADALWIDAEGHDPYVLTAALAAVTYRSLLIVELPDRRDNAAQTLDVVSRGRVLVTDGTALQRITDKPTDDTAHEKTDETADDTTDEKADEEVEQKAEVEQKWEPAELPDGRAEWRQALAEAAERGRPRTRPPHGSAPAGPAPQPRRRDRPPRPATCRGLSARSTIS